MFSHITTNWPGRPLTSHEVIVTTIAATTTRTGLSVHAESDTDSYPTGAKISDAAMAALPIIRHGWHGDWNYTLHPTPSPTADTDTATSTDPDTPPDPATLSDPALTGMSRAELDALTTALDTLRQAHAQARHHEFHRHQADRGLPARAPSPGRQPRLPFADQVLAGVLHQRLGQPADTVATLFTSSPTAIRRVIDQTRGLLDEHGTVITPVTLPAPLAELLNKIKPSR